MNNPISFGPYRSKKIKSMITTQLQNELALVRYALPVPAVIILDFGTKASNLISLAA
jgi:hypothetical protein